MAWILIGASKNSKDKQIFKTIKLVFKPVKYDENYVPELTHPLLV